MELKECPFCGSKITIDKNYLGHDVWCRNIDCPIYEYSFDIKAWNHRASAPGRCDHEYIAVPQIGNLQTYNAVCRKCGLPPNLKPVHSDSPPERLALDEQKIQDIIWKFIPPNQPFGGDVKGMAKKICATFSSKPKIPLESDIKSLLTKYEEKYEDNLVVFYYIDSSKFDDLTDEICSKFGSPAVPTLEELEKCMGDMQPKDHDDNIVLNQWIPKLAKAVLGWIKENK